MTGPGRAVGGEGLVRLPKGRAAMGYVFGPPAELTTTAEAQQQRAVQVFLDGSDKVARTSDISFQADCLVLGSRGWRVKGDGVFLVWIECGDSHS